MAQGNYRDIAYLFSHPNRIKCILEDFNLEMSLTPLDEEDV